MIKKIKGEKMNGISGMQFLVAYILAEDLHKRSMLTDKEYNEMLFFAAIGCGMRCV